MAGFLDRFRTNVVLSVYKEQSPSPQTQELNDKIALGVLLWVVAEADEKFLPEEKDKIKDILSSHGHMSSDEMSIILGSIEQAAKERIDLYHFTREVSQDLRYEAKIIILENLFRVACADGDLDHNENELIRKIAGLLRVDHKDFIEAKIKIKKESNLPTLE
ncbi:MAG: TerB family tellurite resistance protein [Candidatus Omnitrophota bacterium]